jgi:hypothetical protein
MSCLDNSQIQSIEEMGLMLSLVHITTLQTSRSFSRVIITSCFVCEKSKNGMKAKDQNSIGLIKRAVVLVVCKMTRCGYPAKKIEGECDRKTMKGK